MTSGSGPVRAVHGYDRGGEVDLAGFAASLLTYAVTASSLAVLVHRSGSAPDRHPITDIAVGGLATYKFSRLVARGSVTSPLRAPFTQFAGSAGAAEHDERPRDGRGARHTVGELLTCPFCLGVWVGTTYVAGLTLAPRIARSWAAMFAVVGLSDFLQHAYGHVADG